MDRFRPSRGSTDDGWFRVGTIEVTTTILIVGLSTLSLFIRAATLLLYDATVLRSWQVRSGQIWRIGSWPLANEISLWTAISIALLYVFGREIERLLGRVRYVWFLAILTAVPGVIAVALDLGVGGIQLIEFALFGVFVMVNPTARSFFNIPLWVFGAVILGIQVLQLLEYRMWDQLVFLGLLCGVALLALRAFNLSDEYPWIPKLPLPAFITKDPYTKANRAREKAKRQHSSKGPKVVPIRGTGHLDRASQADMDMLLDKIADGGVDSLTLAERRRLDEHSRRLRES